MDGFLGSMPAGAFKYVTIQCPDPWFKKRHQKRRMVTPTLATEIARHMSSGGVVFLQSDVEAVAKQVGGWPGRSACASHLCSQ
jgi:tRNA (guanine-N7-)-methyltransferase